jgi:glycosyltransferase involved in cell wall biosynthesis
MIDISIVIITLNEEENIGRLLESIKSQTFPRERMEIIVVDCSPIPKGKTVSPTCEIAFRYTNKVFHSQCGFSIQKNYGVLQSTGKYILNLDGDMIISESLIKECFETCEREGHVALYIPEIIIGQGMWIKARNFERSFYDATCNNCVRFIKRIAFIDIDGFDNNIIVGEDWDFDRRIKTKGSTAMVQSPLYHNEGHLKLLRYMRGKVKSAKDICYYVEKWGRDDPLVKKQLGFRYRYFGVYLENGKWKKLIRHPILTLQMYFLKVTMGFIYLTNREVQWYYPQWRSGKYGNDI